MTASIGTAMTTAGRRGTLAATATATATATPGARPAAPARVACLLCPLLLAACAAHPAMPAGAMPFGAATRAALALQIAVPDAARQARDPAAAGMDGRAASQAQGRYQKSFSEPAQQQSSFTIGVSGAK